MAGLLLKSDLSEIETQYADMIHRSGSALTTILNDILDFSKIEAGKLVLDPMPFHLSEAIEDVVTLHYHIATKKNVTLSLNLDKALPLVVIGDAGRLRQILNNLIGNAIKFTDHGRVNVDVSGIIKDKQINLHIVVSDTGIGISKDKLKNVFEKFTQAETSTTRMYGGTGLGLAIAKELLHLMGGEIYATSTINKGSSFCLNVVLPIAEDRRQVKRTRNPESYLLKRQAIDLPKKAGMDKQIVIVSRIEKNRKILARQINKWGVSTKTVETEIAMLDLLYEQEKATPGSSVAVIDCCSSKHTGLGLVYSINADHKLSNVEVLMLSTLSLDKINIINANKNRCTLLSKPISSTKLHSAYTNLITNTQVSKLRGLACLSGKQAPQNPNVRMSAHILVAEDNEQNRILMEHVFRDVDFQVTFVENGKKAIELHSQNPFDAILMDISMPIMNGLDATASIRKAELEVGASRVPIIAITAHAMSGDKQKFLDAGMDDYLAKPIDGDLVIATIQKHIAQSQLQCLKSDSA